MGNLAHQGVISQLIAMRELALSQKMLLLAVLVGVAFYAVAQVTQVPLLLIPGALFQLYAVFRICKALETGTVPTVFLILSQFIPCISLIVLVILNQMATNKLQQAGYKVGLMGIKSKDLPGA